MLTGLRISTISLVLGIATLGIVSALACLREYPVLPYAFIAGTVALGLAGLIWVLPGRLGRTKPWTIGLGIATAVLALVPLSAIVPGGITSSRFAFTMVGVCPIPVFDFTISAGGVPVPRDKSHRITWEEVRPLAEDADVVILANGWEGAAEPDPDVLRSPKVRVLKTPDAFELYNRLRREGLRVAILAHTTC